MRNPFMSKDDGVGTDESDREHAGGRADADGAKATAEDRATAIDGDLSLLAESSEYAQRGTTNQYFGQKPDDESGFTGTREARGMHSGSQEQWRGPSPAAAAAPSDAPAAANETDASQETTHDGEAHGDVPGRSTDRGRSGDDTEDVGSSALDASS